MQNYQVLVCNGKLLSFIEKNKQKTIFIENFFEKNAKKYNFTRVGFDHY